MRVVKSDSASTHQAALLLYTIRPILPLKAVALSPEALTIAPWANTGAVRLRAERNPSSSAASGEDAGKHEELEAALQDAEREGRPG